MTPQPLNELRLRPSSHISALWWLGLLYRRPREYLEAASGLSNGRLALLNVGLSLHFFFFVFIVSVLIRILVFGGEVGEEMKAGISNHLNQIAEVVIFGIGKVREVGISGGVALGVSSGVCGTTGFGLTAGEAIDSTSSMIFATTFGAIGAVIYGIEAGIATGVAAAICWTRAYYLPAHFLLVFPRPRVSCYRFHPVAWDDLCSAPFLGLHQLLVAYAEKEPRAGSTEIDRLIESYPSQKAEALKARTILVLREAGKAKELSKVDGILAGLPEGEKGYLAQTQDARRLAQAVTTEVARLETADRPFLQEPAARGVVSEIQALKARAAGFHEPLSTELQAAADRWLKVAGGRLEKVRQAMDRAPLVQPFRAGDPVDSQREAFVQRFGVIGDLEQQVRLAEGSPGILVTGRRRVGKSTVLRNLPHFLPASISLARLSLQDAKVFTSQGDFCATVGGAITAAVGERKIPDARDLPSFMDLLEAANDALGSEKRRLIVSLDEYEGIDVKIGEGVFSEDLLATLRESIQRHRRIIWMFAGVHEMTELPNAPWSSYLVSTRLLEVPLFTEAETRLLLTEPMKQSALWRDREEERPRFEPGFWGEDGIERIQAETGGWPHLVQLVAEVLVDLLNRKSLPQVTPEVFEEALDAAVVRGHAVFYELMRRESRLPGEWEYLEGFRRADHLPLPENTDLMRSLERRLIVLPEDDHLRLRVPLMGRWLRARG